VHAVLARLKAHAKAHARLARADAAGVAAWHLSEHGQGGLTFVNLHQNEQTSVEAARALLREHPGRLIELRGQGTRVVTVRRGLAAHTADPNRIFTDAGLAATLGALGPDTTAARAAMLALRDALLALLPADDGRPIVALHNTNPDYGIDDYGPGAAYAGDAARVHVGQPDTPQDFFLVTQPHLFDGLAQDGFNVVLQAEHARDDGSLSIWAARAGRAYVNVEAAHGHLEAQRRMLEAVVRRFGATT
jgi:hypothetical protein